MVKRRHLVQALGALAFNGYLPGFLNGTIYTGSGKAVCVPVLNCYSCPGAVGACPVGAAQSIIGGLHTRMTYYVLGLLVLFGILGGRIFCGWLCPFGFFQDLLHRLPGKKITVPHALHRVLRLLKYVMLAVFVVLLPLLVRSAFGMGDPWFCKWICPAGTLEAGIPLLALNEGLRSTIGALFYWKLALALFIVGCAVFIYRFFCRYLCPLGAFYGLFNAISVYRLRMDEARCTHCGACQQACRLQIDPQKTPNHPDCIRCHDCTAACPTGALHATTAASECGQTDPKKASDL